MAFMPENSPLVLLALLLTCFLLAAAGSALVIALVAGKRALANQVLAGGMIVLGGYFGLLLVVSFMSHENVLGPGGQKYFCEMDCHEAYSVTGVRTAKTLGLASKPTAAQGVFFVVTVKVWFDERTISSHRGYAPLTPNLHVAAVVDDAGRQYPVSPRGQEALEALQGKSIPFTRPLRPGESYETALVFDLPPAVKNPCLYISTPELVTRFLIGHENSFLHKKVLFQLVPGDKEAAANTP